MRIEYYISQLLYRYQCVTVPGLGAFLTEIQSARIHPDTYTFYPPKKLISFNSHIRSNDGLLANHIAISEKMPYETALQAILTTVKEWKNQLHQNEAVVLSNIGQLSLNNDKNLVFVPEEKTNYLTDAFGLGSFISHTVLRKEEVLSTVIEETAEKAPVSIVPKKRNRSAYLKYAALLTAGISLAGFGAHQWFENQTTQKVLLVEKAVQEQIGSKIQEATFFIENPLPAVTLAVKEEKKNYHVVGGAFREEKNADKELNSLLEAGFNARKGSRNKYGLYPVYYGSFSQADKARQVLEDVKKHHNPQAWLLVHEE